MADAAKYKAWLDNNADKAGTTDFVTVTEKYNELMRGGGSTAPAPAAATSDDSTAYTDLGVPIGQAGPAPAAAPPNQSLAAALNLGSDGRTGMQAVKDWYNGVPPPAATPDTSGLPTLQEKLAQDRGNESPNSLNNLADRAFTSVVTAVPDTGIALYNAAARLTGNEGAQADYLAPQMRANAGAKEMDPNAPAWQRYAEGAGAAILGGGVRQLLPAMAGVAGSDIGQAVAEKYGLDKETMALIGGVLGGNSPRVGANIGRSAIASLYGDSGRPNAAATFDAADRVGVRPTAGMLGNQRVEDLEASLQRRPGSGPTVDAARAQARAQMVDAVRGVAEDQGATMSRAPMIGGAAQQTARTALEDLNTRSSAGQEALQQAVGSQTPVEVLPLIRQMRAVPGGTTPELSAPVTGRLGTLMSMVNRAEPDPVVQGPPTPTVDYGRLKDWSGVLRQNIDSLPPLAQHQATPIQGTTRGLMRDTAIQQGVPPHVFDAVQGRTRALTREDTGYRDILDPIATRSPGEAYNYLLKGGEQNPQRLTDFRSGINASQGTTAGEAATGNILGSHINRILDQTFLKDRANAPGPIRFADRISAIHDESLPQYAGGPQGAQTLTDVAALARELHRPTVQGGASKAAADVMGQAVGGITKPLIAGGTAAMSGADAGMSAALAALASKLPIHPINNLRTSMMQSDPALAAMAGRPTPWAPTVDINGLKAAMMAMQGSQIYPTAPGR